MYRGFRFRFSLLLLGAVPAAAQVEIGIKAGVPLTDFILNTSTGSRFGSSRVTSAPRRYTLGPFADFTVRGAFSVEAGALYKRFGFDTVAGSGAFAGPFNTVTSRTTGNSWEFPLLAKLRVRWFPHQAGFVAAGPVIRRLTGVHESGARIQRSLFPPPETIETTIFDTGSPPGMDRRTSVGVAVGAGLEFAAGPMRFEPSIRLTRWDTERTASIPSPSRLARRQAEFLLGIGYAAGRRERAAAHIPARFEPGILVGLSLSGRTLLEYGPGFTTYTRPAHRLAAGALLDWRFHPRFSLEGSFLVRPFGHSEISAYPGVTFGQSLSGYAWEVPLLFKWRPWKALAVGTGPALRRAGSLEWISRTNQSSVALDASWLARTAFGWAASAGAEFRVGAARFRPEVRYMWFDRPLYDFGAAKTRQESLAIVLGVSWFAR